MSDPPSPPELRGTHAVRAEPTPTPDRVLLAQFRQENLELRLALQRGRRVAWEGRANVSQKSAERNFSRHRLPWWNLRW